MRFILIILVIGLCIWLNSLWTKRYDEGKAKQEAAAGQAAQTKLAPKPSPAAAKPAKPQVSWPPKRAELEAVIPQYADLEAQFRSAAARCSLQLSDEDLLKAIYQGWFAMTGRGGTPLSRLEWEMGMFGINGATRPFDHKSPAEREAKYSVTQGGGVIYTNRPPAGPEGVVECWEKIEVGRGTERKITGNMELLTIGGTRLMWLKLTWSPEDKAWVRKTPAERRQFFDEYEGKLKTQLQEAQGKASAAPNLDKVNSADTLRDAFKPAFEARFLSQFIKEFRDTPWAQP